MSLKTKNPALKRIYEIIMEDGKAHSYDDLLAEVAPLIPEEEAIIKYNKYRLSRFLDRHPDASALPLDDSPVEYQVAIGRREIIRNSVVSARHIGIKIENGRKMLYYHENAVFDPEHHRPPRSLARRVAAGRPPSAELQAAYAVLADGEWHDLEEVLAAMCRVIPPGKAVRHREHINELQRRKQARRPIKTEKRRSLGTRDAFIDIDTKIAVGRRELARRALRVSKKIVTRKDEQGRFVRLATREEIASGGA